MVLNGDIPCRNTSTFRVCRSVIVHILPGLIAFDLIIACKYWPPMGNVTGQHLSQKNLKKNYCSRWPLLPYILTDNDTRRICHTCSASISFRTTSRIFESIKVSKGLRQVSAFSSWCRMCTSLLEHLHWLPIPENVTYIALGQIKAAWTYRLSWLPRNGQGAHR